MRQSFEGNQGEETIDTRTLGQGVYILNVYNQGEVKASKKLVVGGKFQ